MFQYEQQGRSEERYENPGNIVTSIMFASTRAETHTRNEALLSVALAMGEEEVREESKDALEDTLEKLSQGKVPTGYCLDEKLQL